LRDSKELQAPILVLHGDKDPILPVANGHHFAQSVARVKLEEVLGMGHILQKEVCDELLEKWKRQCIDAVPN